MGMLKRVFCKIVAVLLSIYSLGFFGAGIVILFGDDMHEGRLPGFIIALGLGVLLGFAARKLFHASRRPKKQPDVSASVIGNRNSSSASVITATVQQQEVSQQMEEVTHAMDVEFVSQEAPQETKVFSGENVPTELAAERKITHSFNMTVRQQAGTTPILKINAISDDVKDLLWIKNKTLSFDNNLANEPSLIDLDIEIKSDTYNPIQDIGYYPSYRNLKPENRFIYLNWLCDITAPIPIGYVFIFYYGLERHLLFGKFEQAFDMIVTLRKYHKNESFYAYSADALLIAALYHKRADLISKIDLNKATPKLVQFVIASLTGRVDSRTLIANGRDVGFTNQRYIKNDYELFRQLLEQVLQEKFGCDYYPVAEDEFLQCESTFPLVLANYSLKMNERIANAPDISTTAKYRQDVFEVLSETHERVKTYKKMERSKKS